MIDGAELFIPLAELIDFEKEIARLERELENIESELKRVNSRLGNEGFVSKAPAKLIEEEKGKLEKYTAMHKAACERLTVLRSKV